MAAVHKAPSAFSMHKWVVAPCRARAVVPAGWVNCWSEHRGGLTGTPGCGQRSELLDPATGGTAQVTSATSMTTGYCGSRGERCT